MCYQVKIDITVHGMKLEGGFLNLHNGGEWTYIWIDREKCLTLDPKNKTWNIADVDWEVSDDFICAVPTTPHGIESGVVMFPNIDVEQGTVPEFTLPQQSARQANSSASVLWLHVVA
jgi:hypothetical protein